MANIPKPSKKKSPMTTAMMFAAFGLVLLIMFDESLRATLGHTVGYAFVPLIGFNNEEPVLTIFLASIILVIFTTIIRHFLVDWVNMARVQEAMRAFQKEFMEARKANNTYKIKKLTDAQPEIMQLQASMTTDQMKPMAFTMILVIPIFAWLYEFMSGIPSAAITASVPWNPIWNLNDNWWILPRWILLYSLFGIPFGIIAQKVLKLWEYRNVDLDGDGVPAGAHE